MSFKDRVESFRNRSNGEGVTSPNMEGLEPMTEETEPTADRGLPPLDLTSSVDAETDPGQPLEHLEALFGKVLAAEDRELAMRFRAEEAEADLKRLDAELSRAESVAQRSESNRILAENGPLDDQKAATEAEAAAIEILGRAKTARAQGARRVEVLRGELGLDPTRVVALREVQAAANALLDHEREVIAAGIANRISLACREISVDLAQLASIIRGSTIFVGDVAVDADLVKKLLAWAGVRSPEPNEKTTRLLDIVNYASGSPGLVKDDSLRTRGVEFLYEASRPAKAPRPLWRIGDKLKFRNARRGAVGILFAGRNEVITLAPGEIRDLTEFGIPDQSTRSMIDSGELELVKD